MRYDFSCIKKIPRHIFILTAIILVGTFLRLYDFHNLLDFGSDQAVDATRIAAVVDETAPWPYFGPDMSNSGSGGRATRFRLGPMYYYFEIISAKLFGVTPDAMAYPDALFSVLAIPLLYYFLRRYFPVDTSLWLTGLYAVSFYSLTFSHSAWNPNSIPFFTLLLLLSLWEFLVKKEAVHWGWVVALGVSLGVGFQLHAITLVLFPATAFCVFLYTMKQNWRVWPKWLIVLLIFFILNLGQIIGEFGQNFKNTQTFLNSVSGADSTSKSGNPYPSETFFDNVSCHIEANAHMLTSFKTGDCNFLFVRVFDSSLPSKTIHKLQSIPSLGWMVGILAFSVVGYGLLIARLRKEKDRPKKQFLGLVLLFSVLSFIVLLPVVSSALRYFVHTFFMPLIFVGLLIEVARGYFPRRFFLLVAMVGIVIIGANLFSLRESLKDGGVQGRLTLGQAEAILDTMAEFAGQDKWLVMNTRTITDTFRSVRFLASLHHWSLESVANRSDAPSGVPVLFITPEIDTDPGAEVKGNPIESYRSAGGVTVYKLK
ncbi:MAG: glycosyltransferase family 39 protein [Candidatus Moraniibacteriota bacterium]